MLGVNANQPNPCKGCMKRHAECHIRGNCPPYDDYHDRCTQRLEEVGKLRQTNDAIMAAKMRQIQKFSKKSRRVKITAYNEG